jgi:hypothetical protein
MANTGSANRPDPGFALSVSELFPCIPSALDHSAYLLRERLSGILSRLGRRRRRFFLTAA